MRALILQFDAGNPPEYLGEHLHRHGVEVQVVRMDLPHQPLSLEGIDILAGLGGEMNADQVDTYPYLLEGRELLRTAVERGLPCLGICLSGQLLARAFGAEVTHLNKPEIGVVPVELCGQDDDPLLAGLPSPLLTTQFHEDTFGLPRGATLLGSSTGCRTQIARCAPRAYALQFHPEVALSTFERWLDEAYAKTTGDDDPASQEAVKHEVRAGYAQVRSQCDLLFEAFIRLALPAAVENL